MSISPASGSMQCVSRVVATGGSLHREVEVYSSIRVFVPSVGYDIQISPASISLSSSTLSTFEVSLTLAPLPGKTVFVTLDSSDARHVLSLSSCTLLFTDSNWNVPQTVYVVPRPIAKNSDIKKARTMPVDVFVAGFSSCSYVCRNSR
jgi:hypothetical protein